MAVRRPGRTVLVPWLVVAALALAGCGSTSEPAAAPSTTTAPAGEEVTFVVPEGTVELLGKVRSVDIMPDVVEMEVGDTLVIHNQDVEQIEVGPYFIRPGETLRQTFQRPQTITGSCGLSTSGTVEIIVT